MTEAYDWCGRCVLDASGAELGKVDEIYLDLTTGRFEWALVHPAPLGSRSRFVPLAGAQTNGQHVVVSVSKEQVMHAPIFECESDLSLAEERQLFEHYDLPYDRGPTDADEVGQRSLTSGCSSMREGLTWAG